MTVRRLLRYYGRLKGRAVADIDKATDDWMARMELPGVLDRQIETLSKGMSQKVQFVAAVIASPSLLILDEPFSGLDPVNAQVLKDAVLEVRRRGTTVVFSTHDMATAERMCDRIFMIFRGRKVLDGTLQEIQQRYGADTVHLRTSSGAAALAGIPDVESVNDFGQLQEVRLKGDPQLFLSRIAERTSVFHFEITRPSLHDIFVRIAKPPDEGAAAV
jgi:ABC-2 type transport system ATP-binding protein